MQAWVLCGKRGRDTMCQGHTFSLVTSVQMWCAALPGNGLRAWPTQASHQQTTPNLRKLFNLTLATSFTCL
jgi:hypothetical protein